MWSPLDCEAQGTLLGFCDLVAAREFGQLADRRRVPRFLQKENSVFAIGPQNRPLGTKGDGMNDPSFLRFQLRLRSFDDNRVMVLIEAEVMETAMGAKEFADEFAVVVHGVDLDLDGYPNPVADLDFGAGIGGFFNRQFEPGGWVGALVREFLDANSTVADVADRSDLPDVEVHFRNPDIIEINGPLGHLPNESHLVADLELGGFNQFQRGFREIVLVVQHPRIFARNSFLDGEGFADHIVHSIGPVEEVAVLLDFLHYLDPVADLELAGFGHEFGGDGGEEATTPVGVVGHSDPFRLEELGGDGLHRVNSISGYRRLHSRDPDACLFRPPELGRAFTNDADLVADFQFRDENEVFRIVGLDAVTIILYSKPFVVTDVYDLIGPVPRERQVLAGVLDEDDLVTFTEFCHLEFLKKDGGLGVSVICFRELQRLTRSQPATGSDAALIPKVVDDHPQLLPFRVGGRTIDGDLATGAAVTKRPVDA